MLIAFLIFVSAIIAVNPKTFFMNYNALRIKKKSRSPTLVTGCPTFTTILAHIHVLNAILRLLYFGRPVIVILVFCVEKIQLVF